MRFYRVHLIGVENNSTGFQWFSSKQAAAFTVRHWLKDNKTNAADVMTVDIDLTRSSILEALATFASHPDNG